VSADTVTHSSLSNNLIGDTSMKHIYVYTTPLYETRNWYKIGETTQDPKERIRSQDNASNPEQLIFVYSWEVPQYVTDFKVHKKLERLGFDRIRREWFELSEKPVNDVISALQEIMPIQSINIQDNTPIFLSNIPVLNYTEMWWFKNILPPC
jgi:hypothetical protein